MAKMKQSFWKQSIPYLIGLFVLIVCSLAFNEADTFSCAKPANNLGDTSTANIRTQPEKEIDEIDIRDLPAEVRDTLRLIKKGGPFPYSTDGTVFSNYEGLLPQKPSGYYHEYTVITPGSPDRGARRIIAGDGGEYYYTIDHYRSFKRIKE